MIFEQVFVTIDRFWDLFGIKKRGQKCPTIWPKIVQNGSFSGDFAPLFCTSGVILVSRWDHFGIVFIPLWCVFCPFWRFVFGPF